MSSILVAALSSKTMLPRLKDIASSAPLVVTSSYDSEGTRSAATSPFATASSSAPLLTGTELLPPLAPVEDLIPSPPADGKFGGSGGGRFTASFSVVPRAASSLMFGAFQSTSPISASGFDALDEIRSESKVGFGCLNID
ncbi:hypothetical protein PIB30_065088 [Stylosanthes scabra]|uniref:Secreted protein n=1 Tax=Stylosanthes scabra TaxID=79078 RepID=A0ABU6SMD2_9FABA|nr:hypothetical protein [Stylosanthes scabra]